MPPAGLYLTLISNNLGRKIIDLKTNVFPALQEVRFNLLSKYLDSFITKTLKPQCAAQN